MYIYLINSLALLSLHFLFYKYRNFKFENFIWIFVLFLLSIFVGFRNEIGGDWIIYEKFYHTVPKLTFYQTLNSSLVYVYINKIAYYTGTEFVGVNVICA